MASRHDAGIASGIIAGYAETGANVVTTEYSDRATQCPVYRVTAVQVAPAVHRSQWQQEFEKRAKERSRVLERG